MITEEDIERLGKAQAEAGTTFIETLMNDSSVEESTRARELHEAAAKEWIDAAHEFVKQKNLSNNTKKD